MLCEEGSVGWQWGRGSVMNNCAKGADVLQAVSELPVPCCMQVRGHVGSRGRSECHFLSLQSENAKSESTFQVTMLPGDGVGPELMHAVKEVFKVTSAASRSNGDKDSSCRTA